MPPRSASPRALGRLISAQLVGIALDVPELTEDVRHLLIGLGSVEAVETLVLLMREPERWWNAEQVGLAIHLTGRAQPSLERLAHKGLLDIRLGETVLYKYAPASEILAMTVRELAREYDKRRLLVLELLVIETLDPRSAIAAFAEAFRIRRKKKDG